MKPKSIKDLKPDAANARKHDPRNIGMIADALNEVGAARSIVIDEDNNILAGNGTVEAAGQAGITRMKIVEADGNEIVAVRRRGLTPEQKKRLSLFDNRTAELADWDTEILKQLAEDGDGAALKDLFYDGELDDILKQIAEKPDDDLLATDFALPGALALKRDMQFPSDEIYGIPAFRSDMLVECPQPITTWAGPDATDESEFYFYNANTDSIRGLDLTRTVIGFYTEDDRFESAWEEPDIFTGKLLNRKPLAVLSPNFSLWVGSPSAVQIWNTYRSRWVGRYFQEAGLKIIPDVNWSDEASFKFCFAGIPVGAPCLAMQLQTVKSKGDELQRARRGIQVAIERLKPESLLLYVGDNYEALIADMIPGNLTTTVICNRVQKRRKIMQKKGGEKMKL